MLIDKIRRITRDGRWIPEIDGLRFIAISSVLLFHIDAEMRLRSGVTLGVEPRYRWLSWAINNGDRGVRLFFVISGMILAMPFARHALAAGKPVSLRKYYMRRVTRLEPPYVLAMALFTAMLAIYMHGHLEPKYGGHALASMLYQHGLLYGTMSPVNPVTWSLEVEIQFYILAPLVMLVFRIPGKVRRRGLMLLTIVLMGLAQFPFQGPRVQISILFYLQYFLAGLLLADVFVLDLPQMRTSWWWDAAGFAGLAYTFAASRMTYSPQVVLPLLLAVVCLAAMRSVLLRSFVAHPWVAVMGGMCYSIYLLHFALIAVFFKLTHRVLLSQFDYLANLGTQVLLLGIPVVVCSALFFVWVERPCMDPDWPGKVWHLVTGRGMDELAVLDAGGISGTTARGAE